MDILDNFEATTLNDPLADLDRLLDLLSERYGAAIDSHTHALCGCAAASPMAESIREPASRATEQ